MYVYAHRDFTRLDRQTLFLDFSSTNRVSLSIEGEGEAGIYTTPTYLRYARNRQSPSIELYRRTPAEDPVQRTMRLSTYVHATEVNRAHKDRKSSPTFFLLPDKRYRIPRVLASIAFEEDHIKFDLELWTRWFDDTPFQVADMEVFPGFSTLVMMSVPLPVWNLFPGRSSCSFLGYATAPKIETSKFPFRPPPGPRHVHVPAPISPAVGEWQPEPGDQDENAEDDDEEEMDDLFNRDLMSQPIIPTQEGFEAHIQLLNPDMDPTNDWLLKRFAFQQRVRHEYSIQS